MDRRCIATTSSTWSRLIRWVGSVGALDAFFFFFYGSMDPVQGHGSRTHVLWQSGHLFRSELRVKGIYHAAGQGPPSICISRY